jgi:hypothetical protein
MWQPNYQAGVCLEPITTQNTIYGLSARSGRSLTPVHYAGSMVGAFVATAMAWQKYGNDSVYVNTLMTAARTLYTEANKFEGSFGMHFK